jgi:hypothetical protein
MYTCSAVDRDPPGQQTAEFCGHKAPAKQLNFKSAKMRLTGTCNRRVVVIFQTVMSARCS